MNILNEEWRDVSGFEGFYQVSSLGRVRSLDRYVRHPAGGKSLMKGQLRKLQLDRDGYLFVLFAKESCQKCQKVHALVAQAFIGDRPLNYDVNHIDGIKTNNCPSNLEYCTRSNNLRHAYKLGLSSTRGDKSHVAKLTSSDVLLIRQRFLDGFSNVDIARDFGVAPTTISSIRIGNSWSHTF